MSVGESKYYHPLVMGMKLPAIILLLFLSSSLQIPKPTITSINPTINDPWNGICEGTNIEVWKTSLERSKQWNFNVHRLAFQWDTPDLYYIINDILGLIDSYGARVVLDYHHVEGYALVKLGSEQLKQNWKYLVSYFKDDPRIIAWEIFNEPYDYGLDPSVLNSTDKELALMKAQAEITDVIREVDPIRPVVWFPIYDNLDIPPEYRRDNIVLTGHLYSYGSKDNWSDLKRLADFRIANFKTYETRFAKLWLGEFAWHETSAGGAKTESLEVQYDVYVMNYAIEQGWGFNYWAYGKNHYAPPSASADIIIEKTNYNPPAQPPEPTHYETKEEASLSLNIILASTLIIFSLIFLMNIQSKYSNERNITNEYIPAIKQISVQAMR